MKASHFLFACAFGILSTISSFATDTCGIADKYEARTVLPNGDILFELPRLKTNGGEVYHFNYYGDYNAICTLYLGMHGGVSADFSYTVGGLISINSSGNIEFLERGPALKISSLICR